jgi:hypothetical protein
MQQTQTHVGGHGGSPLHNDTADNHLQEVRPHCSVRGRNTPTVLLTALPPSLLLLLHLSAVRRHILSVMHSGVKERINAPVESNIIPQCNASGVCAYLQLPVLRPTCMHPPAELVVLLWLPSASCCADKLGCVPA